MKQQTKRKRKNRLPNGSIPIKHFIFDNIFAKGKLTKRELQIISVIIRDSWGYKSITNNGNWTKDSLRNEDFVQRTEIGKAHISETLKILKERKIVFSRKDGKYSFNEHYESWRSQKVPEKGTTKSSRKGNSNQANIEQTKTSTSSRKGNSSQKGNFGVPKKGTFKRRNKQLKEDTATVNIKEINKGIYSLFDYWNSLRIIVHKNIKIKIGKQTLETCIKKTLENYSLKNIQESMKNYKEILEDKKYYYSHRSKLGEFLEKRIDQFLTINKPFENYFRESKKGAEDIEPPYAKPFDKGEEDAKEQ